MEDKRRNLLMDELILRGLNSPFANDSHFWIQLAEAALDLSTRAVLPFSVEETKNLPRTSFATEHGNEGVIAIGNGGLYITYYHRPFKKISVPLSELERGLREGGVYPEFTIKRINKDASYPYPIIHLELRDSSASVLLKRLIIPQAAMMKAIERVSE